MNHPCMLTIVSLTKAHKPIQYCIQSTFIRISSTRKRTPNSTRILKHESPIPRTPSSSRLTQLPRYLLSITIDHHYTPIGTLTTPCSPACTPTPVGYNLTPT